MYLSSLAPPRSGNSERLRAFDGFRGYGVLCVILVHSGYIPFAWIVVDIFFAMSGFLITGILLDAKEAGASGWSEYFKPFYIRRCLRILPMAYIGLAVVFVFLPAIGFFPPVTTSEQFYWWAYLSNWYTPQTETAWKMGQYWSLALEEQFYFLMPWLVLAVSRKNLIRVCSALIVLAPIIRYIALRAYLPVGDGHAYHIMTPMRMDALAAGSLLAALDRDGGLQRLHSLASFIWIPAIVAFAAIELLMNPGHRYVLRYSFLALAITSAIVIVVNDPDCFGARILSFRWVRWIGMLSYTMYIVHVPIVVWLKQQHATALQQVAVTLPASLLIAALSWYLVEFPILSQKKRWPMGANRFAATAHVENFTTLTHR